MTRAFNLGALYDADVCGDGVALIDVRDWDHPRSYTHREVDGAANALARGLLKRGFKRGDAIAILATNRAEYVISFLAILRAGLVAVPVSHKFPRATVEYVLNHAGVKHVLCDDARRALVPDRFACTSFDDAAAYAVLHDAGDFANPNVVKVVCDARGRARYFSRAPIPFARDAWGPLLGDWLSGQPDAAALQRLQSESLPAQFPCFRHIGIYAYRAGFLKHYAALPRCPLEDIEALEQLRVLWHGYGIRLVTVDHPPEPGVDTPEDLARVRQIVAGEAR